IRRPNPRPNRQQRPRSHRRRRRLLLRNRQVGSVCNACRQSEFASQRDSAIFLLTSCLGCPGTLGVLVNLSDEIPSASTSVRKKATFSEDFRRFFRSGLAALLPT